MKKILILAMNLLVFSACNQNGDLNLDHSVDGNGQRSAGGRVSDGNANDHGTSCKDAWNRFVAANPVGRFQRYVIESKTDMAGSISFPGSKSERSVEVVSSSADQVTFKEINDGHEKTYQQTQSEATKGCNRGAPGESNSSYNVEVIENSIKAIRTPAGSFNCTYIKAKLTPKSAGEGQREMISERYTNGTDGYGLLVKSITTISGQTEQGGLTRTTVTELVELR